MNGPHDLGGAHGLGPVAPEKDEPYFHGEWEKRALGVTLSCGAFGAWTIDESRHARESLPPATYLSASYYEIWTRALETLLKRHGFVTQAELDGGHRLEQGTAPKRVLKADMVAGGWTDVSVWAVILSPMAGSCDRFWTACHSAKYCAVVSQASGVTCSVAGSRACRSSGAMTVGPVTIMIPPKTSEACHDMPPIHISARVDSSQPSGAPT